MVKKTELIKNFFPFLIIYGLIFYSCGVYFSKDFYDFVMNEALSTTDSISIVLLLSLIGCIIILLITKNRLLKSQNQIIRSSYIVTVVLSTIILAYGFYFNFVWDVGMWCIPIHLI
jgi:hypothetical protein